MKVYLDGRLVDAAEARIDPADRGLTLGDGLYETIAVRGGRPARTAAHLARLRDGARTLAIELAETDDALAAALLAVAEANGIADGVLRLTLTRGPAPRGLAPPAEPRPSLLIAASARTPAPPDPVSAIVATRTRRNEHSPLARIKSTNCLDGVIALAEARASGADEALLVNSAGNLAEATQANVFLVIDGAPVTPPVADGALPGVIRAEVIRAFGAQEWTVTPADLLGATEAFLTNSLGVRPLVAVDGMAIGAGAPGPVAREAQALV